MAFVRVAAKHITKAPKQNVKIIKDNKSYTYTVHTFEPMGSPHTDELGMWPKRLRGANHISKSGREASRVQDNGHGATLYLVHQRGEVHPRGSAQARIEEILTQNVAIQMRHNPITLRKVLFTHSVKCLQNVQAEKNRTKLREYG